jgi:hypothetical protein
MAEYAFQWQEFGASLTHDTLLKLPTVRDVVTCLSQRTYEAGGEFIRR